MARFVFFDYKHKLANWRTRATQIKHVYVYRYNNDKDDKFNKNI